MSETRTPVMKHTDPGGGIGREIAAALQIVEALVDEMIDPQGSAAAAATVEALYAASAALSTAEEAWAGRP